MIIQCFDLVSEFENFDLHMRYYMERVLGFRFEKNRVRVIFFTSELCEKKNMEIFFQNSASELCEKNMENYFKIFNFFFKKSKKKISKVDQEKYLGVKL